MELNIPAKPKIVKINPVKYKDDLIIEHCLLKL